MAGHGRLRLLGTSLYWYVMVNLSLLIVEHGRAWVAVSRAVLFAEHGCTMITVMDYGRNEVAVSEK